MNTNRKEGVTQLAEAGLLPRAISVRLRAPSRPRVRNVNAAHRALTSRSDGALRFAACSSLYSIHFVDSVQFRSSPSGRTGVSMVDSDALNVATKVRFLPPQPRQRRLLFDNLNARDARSLERGRSLRRFTTRGAFGRAIARCVEWQDTRLLTGGRKALGVRFPPSQLTPSSSAGRLLFRNQAVASATLAGGSVPIV
jgi:hypothetical protein